MVDTTLTTDTETVEGLDERRAPVHDSWDDFLVYVNHMLPTMEKLRDGCFQCGTDVLRKEDPDESHFVTRPFKTETPTGEYRGLHIFCSAACLSKQREQEKSHVPDDPDEVVVGGCDEVRTRFEDASFLLDGERMEVSFPLPGAFVGESASGDEYDYDGEPVYVKNDGKWVQHGVVDHIFHEDNRTTLALAQDDYETVMLNHPNPATIEDYKRRRDHFLRFECSTCSHYKYVREDESVEECPNCGEDTFSEVPEGEAADDAAAEVEG